MLNSATIRTIQSGTIEEVYSKVTDAALFMATGGFLNHANKLLTELWKHALPHDRNTWLDDRSFMMLWYISNNKPDFIPFRLLNIDELERYHRGYIALDKWAYEMKERDWKEMSGTDLLRTAFKMASLQNNNDKPVVSLKDITDFSQGKKELDLDEGETFMDGLMRIVGNYNQSNATSSTDSFPSKEKELLAADMLEKYLREFPAAPDALCLAAELNARNNRIDKAIFFAKQWANNYYQHYLSYNFSLMSYGKHVAPLLLKNILAGELKLSEKICDDFTDIAIRVLDKRITDGRSLVYGNLKWKQLIRKLSVLSLKYAPEDFSDDVHKSNWLGFEKTTEKAIKATEKRLKIKFPEDYKNFLKTSNGLLAFPTLNPSLVAIEKIDYLKNIEQPELFKLYEGFPVDDDDPESFEDYVTRAILISEYPEEQMIWLIPPKNKHDNWQTWFFANWVPGENRYPSFRHFIEEQIQALEKD